MIARQRKPIWLHPKTKPLRNLIYRATDHRLVGALEYHTGFNRREFPPFNGQTVRRTLFEAMVPIAAPSYLAETGTFHGNTTAYLAGFGLPVYSFEKHPRRAGYTGRRLRRMQNVQIIQGDTRVTLPRLLNRMGEEPGLFYLDAHRREDVPIREEVAAIHAASRGSVSLIDDVEVPGDPGYVGFPLANGVLTLDFIADICRQLDLCALLPTTPSTEETGTDAGYAVVAARSLEPQLLATGYLRPYELAG